MRILKFTLTFTIVAMIFVSCSKADKISPEPPTTQPAPPATPSDPNAGTTAEEDIMTYIFPVQFRNNTLIYNNTESDTASDGSVKEKTSLEQLQFESKSPFKFSSKLTNGTFKGVFTRTLDNGQLTVQDGKLLYTGKIVLYDVNDSSNIYIPMQNVVIFDTKAKPGEIIFQEKGVKAVQDSFSVVVTGTITSTFDLTITQEGAQDITINGKSFKGVIPTVWKMSNLSMTFTTGKAPDQATGDLILPGSNTPLVLTNYFGKGVGLAASVANLNVPFRNIVDIANQIVGSDFFTEEMLQAAGAPSLTMMKSQIIQVIQQP